LPLVANGGQVGWMKWTSRLFKSERTGLPVGRMDGDPALAGPFKPFKPQSTNYYFTGTNCINQVLLVVPLHRTEISVPSLLAKT